MGVSSDGVAIEFAYRRSRQAQAAKSDRREQDTAEQLSQSKWRTTVLEGVTLMPEAKAQRRAAAKKPARGAAAKKPPRGAAAKKTKRAAAAKTTQRRAAAKKHTTAGKRRAAPKKGRAPSAVQRTTELSEDVLQSLDAGARSAIDAVRKFVDTVEEALPRDGKGSAKREEITDSALEMAQRLVHTQADFLRKVVDSAGKSVTRSGRK